MIILKQFCDFFNVVQKEPNNVVDDQYNQFSKINKGFIELLSMYQGESFGKGLYRLHLKEEIEKWNNIVIHTFPEFTGRITCFGYDWLGRQFAVDYEREENGQLQLLMFEPGTGDVMELPFSFVEFHNEEIPNYHDACLASAFFSNWIAIDNTDLQPKECVGYKTMLFLDGEDTINNLEKGDMEVYWYVCAALINKVKDLPEGSQINLNTNNSW